MGTTRLLALGFAAIVVTTGSAHAGSACTATSGRDTLPLIELYTSEGCDSCPPADRWLSATFPPEARPAASVLAFHVDYWDRLGWKDRFASADYTARQYASMRARSATFVYTPQVLVQGRDVDAEKRLAALASARARPARATLSLEARDDGAGVRLRASIPDQALRRTSVAWLAYTESGLSSDVKAGENRGAQLHHDHVVRALFGPFAFDQAGQVDAAVDMSLPAERGRDARIVALVQSRESGEVLQTLTMPACR